MANMSLWVAAKKRAGLVPVPEERDENKKCRAEAAARGAMNLKKAKRQQETNERVHLQLDGEQEGKRSFRPVATGTLMCHNVSITPI